MTTGVSQKRILYLYSKISTSNPFQQQLKIHIQVPISGEYIKYRRIHTKTLQKHTFDIAATWSKPLASIYPQIQLLFGQGMLLNVKVIADWEETRMKKKQDIDKNINTENSLCADHDYKVGDKVLNNRQGHLQEAELSYPMYMHN